MRAEPMIEGLVCRSGWESGIVKAVQEDSTTNKSELGSKPVLR